MISLRLTLALLCTGLPFSVEGNVLVNLDATALPAGPLVSWNNTGTVGGTFTREIDTPQVTTLAGVKGVTLDGNNDWFVGPVPPSSVTGNGSRSIVAWVYNPSTVDEETVIAWGRRGGGAGTNLSFNHGHHPVWGAAGHWDAPDIGWNGRQETGVWSCVAYTYESATGMLSVYTNGTLSNSKSIAPLATWVTSTTGAALPFVVGCQNAINGVRDNFQLPAALTIARIRVHDRALSPLEITNGYNAEAATFGRAQAALPVILSSFSAATEAIYRGASTTLSWTVSGHETLGLSPAVPIPGGASSVIVSPLQTTTYTLTAGSPGDTKTASVTVLVDPGIPTALDQSVAASRNTAKSVILAASDPAPPAGGFTWTIVAPPAHGSLSGTAPDLTYTPATGYSGTDGFSFKVNDGFADSNTADVSIVVNPPPAAPTGATPSTTVIAPTAGAGSFIANLAAVDPNLGETHTYQLVAGIGGGDNALFTLVGHQLIAQPSFVAQPGSTYSVRVRVTDSSGRTGNQVLSFTVGPPAPPVMIHEVFYDPPGNARTEFVELHNSATTSVDLSGWQFTRGITFTFPPGSSIPPGGHVVVAMDPAAFLAEFGFVPHGPFLGKLSGEGETLELRDAAATVIDEVGYRSEFPWPVSAGADGVSMELIHPSLDNNLGASWRGSAAAPGLPQLSYVTAAATGWSYRPGTSFPPASWRTAGFVPDGSWLGGRAPLGYGTVDGLPLNTTIGGMANSHTSVFARKTFTIAPGEVPAAIRLRYSADDGIIIWLNGTEIARRNVSGTAQDPALTTTANANATEGLWYDVALTNGNLLLNEGTNVIALRAFNSSATSSDFGFDAELIRLAGGAVRLPTPGQASSVHATAVPPQIRQVGHSPQQPLSSEAAVITAKVTDPQGVGSVELRYQIVAPGNFIPATFPRTAAQILADPGGARPVNPAFENPANWTTVSMRDDGGGSDATAADGIFTAVIPARPHRTLVRYRITATDLPGTAIRVPYDDDESRNFAYFVYDGVPDFVASAASVHPAGAGKVWPKALLTSLPVYHWLIRSQDMAALQAYNGSEQMPNTGDDTVLAARRTEDWEGAFVHDGIVYDHVRTRLRGGNSRYGDNEGRFPRGKRHYKFQFNGGHHFQARDERGKPYPNKWSSLAVNKMFGNKGGNGWGMPEEIGSRLWSSFGVPSAETHWFHFRVIDGAAEAPDQYNGDFWGIQQVVEEYEGTFLDARGIEKGNLYKMSDWIWDAERQRRYQSSDMVRDGSEFNTIRDQLHGGQNQAWLLDKVDYDSWYRYSAVAEAIRHYDVFPYTDDIRHALKNLSWHFAPVGSDPARGRVTFLPYDWDASFGPNWNSGWEHANNALYGWDMSTSDGMPYVNKPAMKLEHRNVLREFRDLVWQPGQLNALIDDRAAVIAELTKADRDRWRNAPPAAGTANDDPLDFKVSDMKAFSFTGWSGSTGPTVGAGGRAAYLDNLADGPDAGLLPAKPTITYTGADGHPLDGLSFATGAFADPQGPATFGGMAWRIGEVEDPAAPAHDPGRDFVLEVDPVWESGPLSAYQSQVTIPAGALKLGRSYRARVRMKDSSGRWSHWSDPYPFTTAPPTVLDDLARFLMITEIMYHPPGPVWPGSNEEEFEFIELQNISDSVTLDLAGVRFHQGINFRFDDGDITLLFPGERVLVVKNRAAFEARYGSGLPVAGEWQSGNNLANSGERLALAFGNDSNIHDFSYNDTSPWPVQADGNGPSLVLADPFSAPDHALAASWKASHGNPGNPGFADGPFASWMFARGANDPDAEGAPGMSHAMIYALGADFVADPRTALPAATLSAGTGTERHLTLSYRRRLGATQVSYQVETATDLDAWLSGPGVVEPLGSPVPNGDGTETAQVRVIAPVSADPARFIRLRVSVEN
jgi:hypothetical protein